MIKILDAARLAPSGANRQPLVIVVVSDQKLKAEIRARCEVTDAEWRRRAPRWFKRWAEEEGLRSEKTFLTGAPYLLCVFGDSRFPYWLESVWIAVGYITLAATEQGLGSLTYTPSEPDFMNRLLAVPARLRPVAIVPVGFPSGEGQNRRSGRKSLRAMAFANRYGVQFA